MMLAILMAMALSGCISNRYIITETEYSTWKGYGSEKEMVFRKKTILLDTKTGETWGYAFDKINKPATRDGYGWEKILAIDRVATEK